MLKGIYNIQFRMLPSSVKDVMLIPRIACLSVHLLVVYLNKIWMDFDCSSYSCSCHTTYVDISFNITG